ncbi:MAG: 16S rRNA (guanine(527)-N(7))-methyltransferase RsmG [Azoarcus sp.]|jgi:16S rRNA (guanine527-N7)-methyltransferase|nr:16S rRNA (guanine(527)-N(7))-methyltransferase RsmG [Azoarcus sp.]
MNDALTSRADALAEGMRAIGIAPAPELLARLLAYGELLLKWNRVYNLTALREPGDVITHHLLDSLAVLPWLGALRMLIDIGSGAGLPCIPLALARPGLAVYSVETVGKKASFQQQAKIELRLKNFTVINRRAETLRAADFSVGAEGESEVGKVGVISRAFSSLADFVRLAAPWLPHDGTLYAMKGALPRTEIAALPAGWRIEDTRTLTVPGLDAARHLLLIRREPAT